MTFLWGICSFERFLASSSRVNQRVGKNSLYLVVWNTHSNLTYQCKIKIPKVLWHNKSILTYHYKIQIPKVFWHTFINLTYHLNMTYPQYCDIPVLIWHAVVGWNTHRSLTYPSYLDIPLKVWHALINLTHHCYPEKCVIFSSLLMWTLDTYFNVSFQVFQVCHFTKPTK